MPRSSRSSRSHGPAAGRQTTVLFRSGGQAASVPVQLSATSQTPAAERQTVELAAKSSVGHAAEEPLQLSATSHTPAADRHTVPAVRGVQVPVGLLQAWQSDVPPGQSVKQQVESMQKLLVHWFGAVQLWPAGFWLRHAPARQ